MNTQARQFLKATFITFVICAVAAWIKSMNMTGNTDASGSGRAIGSETVLH